MTNIECERRYLGTWDSLLHLTAPLAFGKQEFASTCK
jgi:hypothetical protein